MPEIKYESCTRLWDIAFAASQNNSDLQEVRLDRTSHQNKSFVFYTVDGKEEAYLFLEGKKISEVQELITQTKEQWLTEEGLYRLPSYLGLPNFSIWKMGSFYVYVKNEGREDGTMDKEEEIFISPYGDQVLKWTKNYYDTQRQRLHGMKDIQSGKVFEPITQQLENAVSDCEKLIKKIKLDFGITEAQTIGN